MCTSHKHELGDPPIADTHVNMSCNAVFGPGDSSSCSWAAPAAQGPAHLVQVEDFAVSVQPSALADFVSSEDSFGKLDSGKLVAVCQHGPCHW